MIFGAVFLFHKRVIEWDYQDYWEIELIIPILLLVDLVFISFITKCPANPVFILQWIIIVAYLGMQFKLRFGSERVQYEIAEIIFILVSLILMILKSIFTL